MTSQGRKGVVHTFGIVNHNKKVDDDKRRCVRTYNASITNSKKIPNSSPYDTDNKLLILVVYRTSFLTKLSPLLLRSRSNVDFVVAKLGRAKK